jgi:hypothetical protein
MVMDVSAMFVAKTTFLAPSGVGSKIFAYRNRIPLRHSGRTTDLDNSKQNISTTRPLMCFVNDERRIPSKIWFRQKLSE